MIVEGTTRFSAAPDAVWEALLDPAVIAKAMPGTRELVESAPGDYRGRMQVGIGPITAAEFDLRILLSDLEPPKSFVMNVDGNGRFGFTRGRANVSLSPEGTGTTMNYRADLQVGGKIAAVGQRLLDVVSRALLRSGLEALGKEVERRTGGKE
ncbi:MAG: CoxG family protein [Gemmatimonadales bacterium]